jgi:hypothetical protein
MRVLDSGNGCRWPGFLGLDFYDIAADFEGTSSGFTLGSSTGNMRQNAQGERLGDGLWCIFPAKLPPRARFLDYPPVRPSV